MIPASISSSMSISLYAMFIGLLVPNIRNNRRVLFTVLISMCFNWFASQFFEKSWSIIIAILFGGFIGMILTKKE